MPLLNLSISFDYHIMNLHYQFTGKLLTHFTWGKDIYHKSENLQKYFKKCLWFFWVVGVLFIWVWFCLGLKRLSFFDSHVLDYETGGEGKMSNTYRAIERDSEKQNSQITLICLFIEL